VVAQGKVEADGVMRAEEVLAKHDENYMPPEAADALKKAQAANAADSAAKPASPPVTK
jgi:cytochrome c-type biogenesis protein CcmE